jgi:exosortase
MLSYVGTATEQLPQTPPAPPRAIPWPAMAWFSVLLIAAYFPILRRLIQQWSTDDDFSHGFFVPIVALYIAWQRRGAVLRLPWQPAWWGAGVLSWGLIQAYVGSLAAELFLQRSAFLISLTGVLLMMGGAALVRALLFPLLLLLFMIPIPAILFNYVTFPLQILASRIAEFTLDALGIPVLREGNILELASQKLSVAEACSGIRSLLTLTFLSLVYSYFFDSKVWTRWALFFATIPIAILANSGRVTITGILSETNPELAEGFFHSLEGLVISAIAFLMLVAVHRAIKWLGGVRQLEAPADV